MLGTDACTAVGCTVRNGHWRCMADEGDLKAAVVVEECQSCGQSIVSGTAMGVCEL